MNQPTNLLQIIRKELGFFPKEIVSRGRGYHWQGRVRELECIVPRRIYAAVVRGGNDYEVGLEFSADGCAAECSCPMAENCKHIVAALLELEKSELEARDRPNPIITKLAEVARRRWMEFKSTGIPQVPRTKLFEKLTEHLGRGLRPVEADFLREVQRYYAYARARPLTESQLALMAEGETQFDPRADWKGLDLWPEFPADDYQFWLYIAWELRRRNLRWKAFMDGITDLSLIEPVMREWERKREVERWKVWFDRFHGVIPASDPGVLELRLAFFVTEARLEWRTGPDAVFAELKQARIKKLAEQLELGALTIALGSLPLWSAAYRPDFYESWWSFPYQSATAQKTLNRLLRLDLAPELLVTSDGVPFDRISEPLRAQLRPPENGDTDYGLALTTADGSPPPRIWCVLEGRPALYLTDRGLYHGPPSGMFEGEFRKMIPAAALETAEGLRFLMASGVSLPESLARRVQTVPVAVTISCTLQRLYSGSRIEDIAIDVRARAPGIALEELTPEGWRVAGMFAPKKRLNPKPGAICVHDRAAQRHFPRVLEPLELKWQGYPARWKFRLTKKTLELFCSWLKTLPPDIEVKLDRELATLRHAPVIGTISLDVAETEIDWFDLKVSLKVDDITLTQEELKLLLEARGAYVRLGTKGWRRLQLNLTPEDDEQLARLGLNPSDLSAEPQRFHALQLADEAAKKFLGPERMEKIQRRVNELKLRVAPPLPAAISAQMRPYQTEGFHFLAYLTSNRFGGVLADDMGLGKTLQTLAWLAWLRESEAPNGSTDRQLPDRANGAGENETRQPARKSSAPEGTMAQGTPELCSLVVCPKSVMDNWRAEAERFCPGLRVRLWGGEPPDKLSEARTSSDLIVINYSQLRFLSPEISNARWFTAILDEAQYIKNPDSQTAQAARALKAQHRLALTGTPIENRLLDLWSIFGFAMPGALGNRAHFLRRFDAKDDPLARRRLAARVRPFLLRRTKGQVAKDLPDRIEEDLLCEMEGRQLALYRAELKHARQIILGLKTKQQLNQERFTILTSLLRLRQICCHPALVDEKLQDAGSAKLAALEDLIGPLMEEGHKVLVFSQFVTMLDILRQTAQQCEWPCFYLAGETENRGELVRKFQTSSGGAVFLISLRAGGFGLNLTAASYVVLFDPWWNPAVENQAIDRTHRIGQSSKVMAYRLLMRDSIEQKIRALQKQKASLAEDVLGEERFAKSLTLEDLRFLFGE